MTQSCFLRVAVSVVCFGLPVALCAQQSTALLDSSSDAAGGPSALAVSTAPAPRPTASLRDRWLDLTVLSHSERYRNQKGDDGYHYFEDGQQRSVAEGKIKLDAAGNYRIGFRASSGRSFNWAYADYAGPGFEQSLENPVHQTDATNPAGDESVYEAYVHDPKGYALVNGLESAGWEFYMRELYLSATPLKQVTLEVGSFNIEKGYSTEITTFDDDGYIEGERLRLHDKKHLFVDELSVTSAYFGFLGTPNLFARGSGFTKSNYRQVAAKEQLTPRVGVSAEYNWISNNARTNTLREAIVVNVKESKFLDKFRIEGYERVNRVHLQSDQEAPRQGFAIVGEKKIGKLSGDFGFASIDRDYGLYSGSSFAQEVGFSLNGDNYNTGIRIFSHLSYKLTPVVTAFGFYTRITGENITNLDTQGLNAGLTFDLKSLANSGKKVF